MPRRGERQRVFPVVEQHPVLDRIGVRAVQAPDRQGNLQTRTFDPARFRCAVVAAELADEWVDHITGSGIRVITAATYRKGIREFCGVVDRLFGESAAHLTLSGHGRDLGFALAQWERELPAGYPPGSMRPAALASAVRGLIVLRAEHADRSVDADLVRFVQGPLGVEWGASRELDEFSRADKTRMVRAAGAWTRELEQRLSRGWDLALRGRHPAEHGWTRIENLLWGLAQHVITPDDIRRTLPRCQDWPPELRACIEPPGTAVHARAAKRLLVSWLLAQLYPGDLDLHAFRVLLVASTGHAPEEVSDLTTTDVEFLPGGVRLSLTKRRAGAVRHRAFLDRGDSDTTATVDAEFSDRPRRQVSAIVRRLIAVTERTRALGGGLGGRLFVSVAATHTYGLRVGDWVTDLPSTSFSAWLSKAGVTVTGPSDIRRLRKSTKVEKAIAFGGRIADAADDHHEETFRGHYAQGSTLRVLSGEVIATAQQHWFDKATDGPVVLTTAEVFDEPDQLQALGLTAEQAEDLRQGELDMGVTHCRDPYNSPYSPQGTLCAVAPLRCLECRNAWVLPSNLPQLLLFADHLDQLRNRLTPEHFAALWGQSHINLHAVLDERTPQELMLARNRIADGAALHLPLAAQVEFDT